VLGCLKVRLEITARLDPRALGLPSISDNFMVNRAALIVIDGWGERDEEYGNAIKQAATPVMDSLRAEANFTDHLKK
jgi:hypothetical protein